MKKLKNCEKGQGLVEYIVIVALVAIASIGLVQIVGKNVKAHFGKIANTLGNKTTDYQMHRQIRAADVEKPTLENYDDKPE